MRYWISSSMNPDVFPYNTLIVNLIGCFFLSLVVKCLSTSPRLSKNFVNGLGTGFLGSFTTFSTFSVEVSRLFMQGAFFFAACYTVISVFGGFLAAGLGFYFSSRLLERRERKDDDL